MKSHNIVYLIFGFIIAVSCNKEKKTPTLKNAVSKVIIKDTNVIVAQYKNKIYDSLKEYPLPVGDKLVLINFPEKWKISSMYEEVDKEDKGKYEIITDSLYSNLGSFMHKISLKINKEKDSSNYFQNSVNMYFNYYEDYTDYNYMHKIEKSVTVPIGKIINLNNNNNNLLFTLEVNSWGSSYLNIVTIDSKGNIIDGINIGYSKNVFEFSHSGKYYFIDKNRIIHLKSFLSLETETLLQRYEKYQILSNGKIVRYFNKDSGKFNNNEEKGNIQNHTKEGKWVETKPNMYIEEHTYAEAKYKKGLPFGIWKYYNLVAKTKKGDKLLMQEEYDKNGKLLKRTILKE